MIITGSIDFEQADMKKLTEKGFVYADVKVIDDRQPLLDSIDDFYRAIGIELK